MMASPFSYFRGAAPPTASDLVATSVSGLAVQAYGEAHLSNFGIFGSAERHLRRDAARSAGMGRQTAGRRSAFASSVVSICTGT